jgi:hypothetical protein
MCYGQAAVHLAARREHLPPTRFAKLGVPDWVVLAAVVHHSIE